jgi:hypothetical protein
LSRVRRPAWRFGTIENYLGLPTGISGIAFMARAYHQAQKFGVEMAIPDEAVSLSAERNSESGPFTLRLASGEHVGARSVVIASSPDIAVSLCRTWTRLFTTLAAQGGMAEVALAKLAQQKSRNDAVTAFAKRMIDDHAKSNALICQ